MSIKSKLTQHAEAGLEYAEKWTDKHVPFDETGAMGGALGTTLTVVVAAIAMIIGIFVFSEVNNVMPTPENSDLANATDTVVNNAGSAFTLLAVGLIVLAAAFILGILIRRFTRQ